MCILKAFSKIKSFKTFANKCTFPVYSVYDKGEAISKNRIAKENRISFDVSDLEWDEFQGQVTDAITFLSSNYDELHELLFDDNEIYAFLDFPIFSRLNDKVVSQNDHLPRELISLAGKLNLGIEMSIYSREIEE